MEFAKYQLKIAETRGKKEALKTEMSFDQKECIDTNYTYLLENMAGVNNIKVLVNNSFEAKSYNGSQAAR